MLSILGNHSWPAWPSRCGSDSLNPIHLCLGFFFPDVVGAPGRFAIDNGEGDTGRDVFHISARPSPTGLGVTDDDVFPRIHVLQISGEAMLPIVRPEDLKEAQDLRRELAA